MWFWCLKKKSFEKYDFQMGYFLKRISRAPILYILYTVLPTFWVFGLPLFLGVCSPGGDPPSPMFPTLIAKTVVTFFPWHETPQRESEEPTSSPTKRATAPKRPPEDTSFIRSKQLRKNENSTITWLRHGSDSRMPRGWEGRRHKRMKKKMRKWKGGRRKTRRSSLCALFVLVWVVHSNPHGDRPKKGETESTKFCLEPDSFLVKAWLKMIW